ncbi:hypothetical protein EDC55_10315 [Allofrancisella inopinata]|uniref:Uncharacterized protein n=1 Tax=Allofrancisella inopinata TaxID=1085647 RepID=A0AAE7CSF3_9GAMM|nr:hypothetical protein [Allofrancisella inopinata]QIV96693.1 hypothetical protein E4K63_07560 [Allofrancisella inopinata]TDT73446.1 hypothetical protein EDC55_10315 [Allofrancisella inopinata]
MGQISKGDYQILLNMQNLYKELDLNFPEKYKVGGTRKKCFSTEYYMNNEIVNIDTLREIAKFKLHIHSDNPYSHYNKITETVLRHLGTLLRTYVNRSIGHRADLVRYLLIYENIEAILALSQSDMTPSSMKQIMSRCLLYKQLGYCERFFYSGVLSTEFANTFKNIYEETRVLIFELLIEFISQSHVEKVGSLINILTTYREYLFLYSTSSDMLSLEEEENNDLDVNHLKIYLNQMMLGAFSLSENRSKNRYLNIVRFTKQLVQIMEKEFYIKFISLGSNNYTLQDVVETHKQVRYITASICKSYDDFARNCIYKDLSEKYTFKESRDLRDQRINAGNKNGLKGIVFSDLLLAYFCNGFLISSSLGNLIDGSIKSGFIDEVLQRRADKHKFSKMVKDFVSPLINLLKNYIVVSSILIELRIYKDFYIHHGERSRENLNRFFINLSANIQNVLNNSRDNMSKVKEYLSTETSISHKCREMNSIFNQLNLSESSYVSNILKESKNVCLQNDLISKDELLDFKQFFITARNNEDIISILSLFGMKVKNHNNTRQNVNPSMNEKIQKWVNNNNEGIYKTMKIFLEQVQFTKKQINNFVIVDENIDTNILDENINIDVSYFN